MLWTPLSRVLQHQIINLYILPNEIGKGVFGVTIINVDIIFPVHFLKIAPMKLSEVKVLCVFYL